MKKADLLNAFFQSGEIAEVLTTSRADGDVFNFKICYAVGICAVHCFTNEWCGKAWEAASSAGRLNFVSVLILCQAFPFTYFIPNLSSTCFNLASSTPSTRRTAS